MAKLEWSAFFFGFLFLLVGTGIVCISLWDPNNANFHAPRWVVGLIGGLFFFAGVTIIKTHAMGSSEFSQDDLITRIVFAVLLSCFAGSALWVAYGAGERKGYGSISFLDIFTVFRFETGNVLTRVFLSPGALLLLFLAITSWIEIAIRLLKKWKVKT